MLNIELIFCCLSAEMCKPWNLREPMNGIKSCSSITDGYSCSLTCKPGYAFYNQSTASLDYTCTGSNDWDRSSPIPDCIGSINHYKSVSLVVR